MIEISIGDVILALVGAVAVDIYFDISRKAAIRLVTWSAHRIYATDLKRAEIRAYEWRSLINEAPRYRGLSSAVPFAGIALLKVLARCCRAFVSRRRTGDERPKRLGESADGKSSAGSRDPILLTNMIDAGVDHTQLTNTGTITYIQIKHSVDPQAVRRAWEWLQRRYPGNHAVKLIVSYQDIGELSREYLKGAHYGHDGESGADTSAEASMPSKQKPPQQ